jgi:NodT family efflux transporter outer membrane factor (OMF) lipoprotein
VTNPGSQGDEVPIMVNTGEIYRQHKRATFFRHLLAVTIIACAVLSGCAVGPDFRQPDSPKTDKYTAGVLPEKTVSAPDAGGREQRFALGRDIPALWWTLFHSGDLDNLIRLALAASPVLQAAEARLREAQENRRAEAGALLPAVDAGVNVSRQQISAASVGQPDADIGPFNLINASVNVTYTLDLFGGVRRQLEALQAQVDFQQFQLEGAYLTLTSNIVTTAVNEASLRAQISATKEIVVAEQRQLTIIERQFDLGGASYADVLTQRAQLAQTQATLPPLEKALALSRHQLSILAGRLPGEAGLPEFSLDTMQLPEELPVSLPSSLARQRPDIRAAEELLHAASAEVGVATANLYPQLTLSASLGQAAPSWSTLWDRTSTIWSIGAGLLQPLFHGGTLTARRRAAAAAYDQALAQYRGTVLLAFQNVADVLKSLEYDAYILKARSDAAMAAKSSFDLIQERFRFGAVSYLALLDAERRYQDTKISLVQAQAARFADTAALFQALGGGWWNESGEKNTAALSGEE